MKKLYATLACAAVIGLLFVAIPQNAHTSAAQPVAGKTGAPSEGTCANSGCHTSSSGGSGNVSLSFGGGATYLPGVTYTLSITVTDPTASKYGFELTALDGTGVKAGILTITNPLNTAKPTAQAVMGREYISHKAANSNNTWTFDWTAPSTSVGDITFYYSGNGANGTGNSTGDKIYTGSTTISVNTAVQLTGRNNSMFYVQSPAVNELKINYSLNEGANVIAELYDATGKKVMNLEQTQAAAGNHTLTKSLQNIATGLYIVRFSANNRVQTNKVIVL